MLCLIPLKVSSTNHLLITYWVWGIKTYNCWYGNIDNIHWICSVQSLSRVRLFLTPWTAAHQASLSITNSRSFLKLMSIKLVMPIQPSHPLLSPPSPPFKDPASGSFPMSQFFTSGSQSNGVSASASVLPMNIQNWFPLGWTRWISLQSKGLSRVLQKHQFTEWHVINIGNTFT